MTSTQILFSLAAVSISSPPEYWRVGEEGVTRIVATLEPGKGPMGFYRVQVWEKQAFPETEVLKRDIYEPVVLACQFAPPDKIPEGFENAPGLFDVTHKHATPPIDPQAEALARSSLKGIP